jgi:hypothetical protein
MCGHFVSALLHQSDVGRTTMTGVQQLVKQPAIHICVGLRSPQVQESALCASSMFVGPY